MDICRILGTRQDLAGCISVPSLLLHQSMPQFVPLLNAKWILQINLMLKLKASRVNASGSLGSWIIHSSDTYLTLFNFVVEVVHSIAPGVPGLCGHKSAEQKWKIKLFDKLMPMSPVSQFLFIIHLLRATGPVNFVEQLCDKV